MANTVPCIACRKNIPTGATLCSHCGSWQNQWKNNFKYAAGITGVLTFIAGGVAFAVKSFPDALATLTGSIPVAVISLSATGGITVANFGSSNLFISDVIIEVDAPSRLSFNLQIKKPLPAGKTLSEKFAHPYFKREKGMWRYVKDLPPSSKEGIVKRALAPSDPCFRSNFFSSDDPQFVRVKKFVDQLMTFPAASQLNYFSERWGRRSSMSINVIGTVVQNAADPSCQ